MKHTPAPWKWGRGWEVVDKVGTVYHNDGENSEIEKYMDLRLYSDTSGYGKDIIPIRIDHFRVEYDGSPISKADRKLIAAAPMLLEALQYLVEIYGHNHMGIDQAKEAIAAATE